MKIISLGTVLTLSGVILFLITYQECMGMQEEEDLHSDEEVDVKTDESDSNCPCVPRNECPRLYGQSAQDIRELGFLQPCLDYGHVRCCGVSISIVQSVEVVEPSDIDRLKYDVSSLDEETEKDNISLDETMDTAESSMSTYTTPPSAPPPPARMSTLFRNTRRKIGSQLSFPVQTPLEPTQSSGEENLDLESPPKVNNLQGDTLTENSNSETNVGEPLPLSNTKQGARILSGSEPVSQYSNVINRPPSRLPWKGLRAVGKPTPPPPPPSPKLVIKPPVPSPLASSILRPSSPFNRLPTVNTNIMGPTVTLASVGDLGNSSILIVSPPNGQINVTEIKVDPHITTTTSNRKTDPFPKIRPSLLRKPVSVPVSPVPVLSQLTINKSPLPPPNSISTDSMEQFTSVSVPVSENVQIITAPTGSIVSLPNKLPLRSKHPSMNRGIYSTTGKPISTTTSYSSRPISSLMRRKRPNFQVQAQAPPQIPEEGQTINANAAITELPRPAEPSSFNQNSVMENIVTITSEAPLQLNNQAHNIISQGNQRRMKSRVRMGTVAPTTEGSPTFIIPPDSISPSNINDEHISRSPNYVESPANQGRVMYGPTSSSASTLPPPTVTKISTEASVDSLSSMVVEKPENVMRNPQTSPLLTVRDEIGNEDETGEHYEKDIGVSNRAQTTATSTTTTTEKPSLIKIVKNRRIRPQQPMGSKMLSQGTTIVTSVPIHTISQYSRIRTTQTNGEDKKISSSQEQFQSAPSPSSNPKSSLRPNYSGNGRRRFPIPPNIFHPDSKSSESEPQLLSNVNPDDPDKEKLLDSQTTIRNEGRERLPQEESYDLVLDKEKRKFMHTSPPSSPQPHHQTVPTNINSNTDSNTNSLSQSPGISSHAQQSANNPPDQKSSAPISIDAPQPQYHHRNPTYYTFNKVETPSDSMNNREVEDESRIHSTYTVRDRITKYKSHNQNQNKKGESHEENGSDRNNQETSTSSPVTVITTEANVEPLLDLSNSNHPYRKRIRQRVRLPTYTTTSTTTTKPESSSTSTSTERPTSIDSSSQFNYNQQTIENGQVNSDGESEQEQGQAQPPNSFSTIQSSSFVTSHPGTGAQPQPEQPTKPSVNVVINLNSNDLSPTQQQSSSAPAATLIVDTSNKDFQPIIQFNTVPDLASEKENTRTKSDEYSTHFSSSSSSRPMSPTTPKTTFIFPPFRPTTTTEKPTVSTTEQGPSESAHSGPKIITPSPLIVITSTNYNAPRPTYNDNENERESENAQHEPELVGNSAGWTGSMTFDTDGDMEDNENEGNVLGNSNAHAGLPLPLPPASYLQPAPAPPAQPEPTLNLNANPHYNFPPTSYSFTSQDVPESADVIGNVNPGSGSASPPLRNPAYGSGNGGGLEGQRERPVEPEPINKYGGETERAPIMSPPASANPFPAPVPTTATVTMTMTTPANIYHYQVQPTEKPARTRYTHIVRTTTTASPYTLPETSPTSIPVTSTPTYTTLAKKYRDRPARPQLQLQSQPLQAQTQIQIQDAQETPGGNPVIDQNESHRPSGFSWPKPRGNNTNTRFRVPQKFDFHTKNHYGKNHELISVPPPSSPTNERPQFETRYPPHADTHSTNLNVNPTGPASPPPPPHTPPPRLFLRPGGQSHGNKNIVNITHGQDALLPAHHEAVKSNYAETPMYPPPFHTSTSFQILPATAPQQEKQLAHNVRPINPQQQQQQQTQYATLTVTQQSPALPPHVPSPVNPIPLSPVSPAQYHPSLENRPSAPQYSYPAPARPALTQQQQSTPALSSSSYSRDPPPGFPLQNGNKDGYPQPQPRPPYSPHEKAKPSGNSGEINFSPFRGSEQLPSFPHQSLSSQQHELSPHPNPTPGILKFPSGINDLRNEHNYAPQKQPPQSPEYPPHMLSLPPNYKENPIPNLKFPSSTYTKQLAPSSLPHQAQPPTFHHSSAHQNPNPNPAPNQAHRPYTLPSKTSSSPPPSSSSSSGGTMGNKLPNTDSIPTLYPYQPGTVPVRTPNHRPPISQGKPSNHHSNHPLQTQQQQQQQQNQQKPLGDNNRYHVPGNGHTNSPPIFRPLSDNPNQQQNQNQVSSTVKPPFNSFSQLQQKHQQRHNQLPHANMQYPQQQQQYSYQPQKQQEKQQVEYPSRENTPNYPPPRQLYPQQQPYHQQPYAYPQQNQQNQRTSIPQNIVTRLKSSMRTSRATNSLSPLESNIEEMISDSMGMSQLGKSDDQNLEIKLTPPMPSQISSSAFSGRSGEHLPPLPISPVELLRSGLEELLEDVLTPQDSVQDDSDQNSRIREDGRTIRAHMGDSNPNSNFEGEHIPIEYTIDDPRSDRALSNIKLKKKFKFPTFTQRGFLPILPYSEEDPGPTFVKFVKKPEPTIKPTESVKVMLQITGSDVKLN